MQKLLVGLTINHGKEVVSVTVDMPDDYDPMNDSPDIADSFPVLRQAVFDHMSKRPGTTYNEYTRYRAMYTSVIAISKLGSVASKTGGSFSAAGMMAGD